MLLADVIKPRIIMFMLILWKL